MRCGRINVISGVVIGAVLLLAQAAQAHLHPAQGRFMQRDPQGYVDGMSLYHHVRARPTKDRDPTGHATIRGSDLIVSDRNTMSFKYELTYECDSTGTGSIESAIVTESDLLGRWDNPNGAFLLSLSVQNYVVPRTKTDMRKCPKRQIGWAAKVTLTFKHIQTQTLGVGIGIGGPSVDVPIRSRDVLQGTKKLYLAISCCCSEDAEEKKYEGTWKEVEEDD